MRPRFLMLDHALNSNLHLSVLSSVPASSDEDLLRLCKGVALDAVAEATRKRTCLALFSTERRFGLHLPVRYQPRECTEPQHVGCKIPHDRVPYFSPCSQILRSLPIPPQAVLIPSLDLPDQRIPPNHQPLSCPCPVPILSPQRGIDHRSAELSLSIAERY